MKNLKLFSLGAIATATMLTTGCTPSPVAEGFEAVVIERPYIFGDGGMNPTPRYPGREWEWWSTTIVRYDARPNKYLETFEDLIASDNVPVDLQAAAILRLKPGQSPTLHSKFGTNWYSNMVSLKFQNLVRNFARSKTSSDLTSGENITKDGQDYIKDQLTTYLEEEGIPVLVENVFIGKATPPDAVLTEIANTAAQRQRVKTENERKNAEDARKNAERSKAIADKTYKNEFGMTAEQYLQLRQLEIQMEQLQVVKDKDNVHVLLGGNAMPMYPVK